MMVTVILSFNGRITMTTYIFWNNDFFEVLPPDFFLVSNGLPEELLEPLEASFIETSPGSIRNKILLLMIYIKMKQLIKTDFY